MSTNKTLVKYGVISLWGWGSVPKKITKKKQNNRLDLGLNRIRNKGAQAIAQAIPSCQLHELGLKLNFIKDNGALQVAKCVPSSN